ncbi:MAG TPA: hypothetical protein VKP65_13405 [Rhodothermales bacterium]|nr:hypothetical protein [Rhodothermales bacterium]
MSEEKKKEGITIFDHSIRDWIILLGMFTSIAAGGIVVGGTPGQTRAAIDFQTQRLSEDLNEIQGAIETNGRMTQRNALRIDDIEDFSSQIDERLDSLHKTMIEGYRNLDGYFRGRLDQIKGTEEEK